MPPIWTWPCGTARHWRRLTTTCKKRGVRLGSRFSTKGRSKPSNQIRRRLPWWHRWQALHKVIRFSSASSPRELRRSDVVDFKFCSDPHLWQRIEHSQENCRRRRSRAGFRASLHPATSRLRSNGRPKLKWLSQRVLVSPLHKDCRAPEGRQTACDRLARRCSLRSGKANRKFWVEAKARAGALELISVGRRDGL